MTTEDEYRRLSDESKLWSRFHDAMECLAGCQFDSNKKPAKRLESIVVFCYMVLATIFCDWCVTKDPWHRVHSMMYAFHDIQRFGYLRGSIDIFLSLLALLALPLIYSVILGHLVVGISVLVTELVTYIGYIPHNMKYEAELRRKKSQK